MVGKYTGSESEFKSEMQMLDNHKLKVSRPDEI